MAITQNHIINIQPGVSAPLVIHCSQGDTGTQINLTVVNGDEEFDCSSYACSVHGTRSDRANWGPFTCNVSGSTVSFSLTSEMTAVAGSCLAEVSIGTVGTANFALLVENATFENGVTYSNDVSVYQNILNAVQAGLSLAEAAVTNEKNERIAAVNAEATARQTANNILQGNFNSEAATRAAQDASLQSQIDQLVAPSGEAPSAAEVENARIGSDGTVYPTLGDAIRTQNSLLKSALNATTSSTELLNGYKKYNAVFNHGWISASGEYNPSDNRYTSNGILTSGILEVVNNSNVPVYVDYFTQFTDFTSFQLATYTQLNPGQSTLIDRYYPTVCVLSSATQESGLEGILIKGTSQLEYLSKSEHDSIVSDIDAVESEFTDLYTNNAFLATSYTLNGYWNLSNHGVFRADPNYVAVNDYMPVDAGATYYCGAYNKTSKGREISAIPGIFIYYNENKEYIGGDQGAKASITVPSGAKYLRVSITANTYNSYNSYLCGLRKGSPMDYWYPPFKRVLSSDLDRVITVGKTGTEDFYYLKDAVEFATQYDGITVKVNPGTYDLAAEYGSAWLEAMTSTQVEKGLVLKNNIHLVFSPLSVVTFHYRGENTNVQTRFSPFNAGEKGFTLEGLTMKASNCRYCVHDERSGGTEPYTNKYINCDFDFDNSLNSAWSASQIIGGGLGKQGTVLIDNCVFYTYRTTFIVANAVSYHNHSQADSKSIIVVKNCYFKKNNGMRFSWYGASTLITQILVSNNSMGRAIETRAETPESTIENINVIAWNNELRI